MGGGASKPPVVASSECPIYGVAPIGGHHILIAGGGGQARSGIPNLVEVFVLETVPSPDRDTNTVRCVKTTSFDTGLLATMNIDLHTLDMKSGETLVAAGQDELCKIYRAFINPRPMGSEGGKKPPSNAPLLLSYDLEPAKSFQTDFAQGAPGSSYQKVVRFSPQDGRYLATGGADGRVRIWEPSDRNMKKVEEILAHKGEVGDLDLSWDGELILSVGSSDGACTLWSLDAKDGAKKRADVVFTPPDGPDQKFKIRAARFTRLGSRTSVYLTAAVPVQRSSKGQRSFLALWVYNAKLGTNRSCLAKNACKFPRMMQDTISCVALSTDTALTAVGTLSGSVGLYETEDLTLLRWIHETHGIFVTGVAFLPPPEWGPGSVGFGLAADHRASIVSVAADKTIQAHHLPWKKTKPLSLFLVQASFLLLLLTLFFRLIGL